MDKHTIARKAEDIKFNLNEIKDMLPFMEGYFTALHDSMMIEKLEELSELLNSATNKVNNLINDLY